LRQSFALLAAWDDPETLSVVEDEAEAEVRRAIETLDPRRSAVIEANNYMTRRSVTSRNVSPFSRSAQVRLHLSALTKLGGIWRLPSGGTRFPLHKRLGRGRMLLTCALTRVARAEEH
jgi:hypothetical protein